MALKPPQPKKAHEFFLALVVDFATDVVVAVLVVVTTVEEEDEEVVVVEDEDEEVEVVEVVGVLHVPM